MFVWTKIGRGIENCCRNRWGNLYLYFLEIGCNSICIIDLREMDAAVLVTGPNFKSKFNKTARTCHTATCISNGCYLPGHDKLLLDTSPMWYLDVVPRCGTSMWYPDVVPRCGTPMWYPDAILSISATQAWCCACRSISFLCRLCYTMAPAGFFAVGASPNQEASLQSQGVSV